MLKTIGNLLGYIRGYGCCPNCGDSYCWKPTGNLPFEGGPPGFTKTEDEKAVLYVGIQRSVMLCTECIANPARLDADCIAADLTSLEWEQSDIEKVRAAVTRFKTLQAA